MPVSGLTTCASCLWGLGLRCEFGGHHIFRKSGVEEKINLQREGGNAKPYQVRQVRTVILKYHLGGHHEQV